MVSAGITNQKTVKVTGENTAKALGSGELPVYATPAMIQLIEQTALESVRSELHEEESTVGTYLDIKHTSASPVGIDVTCKTELIEVDRSRLRFKVEVTDTKGEVGTGFHERFIVKNEKFMGKVKSKLS